MKRPTSSIDGFIPRRAGSQLGELHNPQKAAAIQAQLSDRSLHSGDTLKTPVGQPRPDKILGRTDIDESLRQIDTGSEVEQKGHKRKVAKLKQVKLDKKGRPRSRKRRIIKWVAIGLAILLVLAAGYVAWRLVVAGGNVFKGSLFDVITQPDKPLQTDANGRTNILVLGTSQDDPGHQGGNLTDSILIISLDQKAKNAYMISVPRDLYVSYDQACPAGYAGKINAYYSCVMNGTSPDDIRQALKSEAAFIGPIVGLDIQYEVNVDYTVVRDTINAIGGSITVNIKGDGANEIMDSNFDWKCGTTTAHRIKNCPPDGHFIDFPNGNQKLNAEQALYLAQARGDSYPNAGLARGDFDRQLNQQKIVKAIRDQAFSAGTLTNLVAVTNLINSLGNNLRTTFATDEIKTLLSLGQSIKDQNIQSVSLIDADPALLTTGNIDGASIVEPTAGLTDYSDIQAFIQKSISSNPVVREGAVIDVYNGSDTSGIAATEANNLAGKGYTIGAVASAPTGTYSAVELYQIGSGNPNTKAALEKLYGVKVQTTTPPVTVNGNTDFVLILGAVPPDQQ